MALLNLNRAQFLKLEFKNFSLYNLLLIVIPRFLDLVRIVKMIRMKYKGMEYLKANNQK